jgi:hypothetical protein
MRDILEGIIAALVLLLVFAVVYLAMVFVLSGFRPERFLEILLSLG